ncbi:Rtr1/RPAP2 family-domain-containing protein [Xylogone sp. PMI_703]|nr:Rtr1/RPAP2 family-domain-containing protein [Xylogone sp. PMI_703]
MATNAPLKSILKKSTPATSTTSKEERDRQLALYHATIIQQRKDVELEILLSTEKLIDFPEATAPYNASNPSPADAHTFKSLLRPFQPSDYDALVQERNINEHCGYTLCPNPRVRETGGGIYRILGMSGKAKDFKVVKKEELEKWCSEACARRALYVRVQLSDTPAWEREAHSATDAEIKLLDEPKSEVQMLSENLERMDLDQSNPAESRQNATNLALERGDTSRATRNGLVNVTIKEKEVQKPAEPPSFEDEDLTDRLDTLHLSLEGHTTRFGTEREKRHFDELFGVEGEDYDMDTDWKI